MHATKSNVYLVTPLDPTKPTCYLVCVLAFVWSEWTSIKTNLILKVSVGQELNLIVFALLGCSITARCQLMWLMNILL